MEHLTADELMDYITAQDPDGDFLRLASRVNAHIGHCPECLRKVRAFLLVQEGLHASAAHRQTLSVKPHSVCVTGEQSSAKDPGKP